MEKLINTIFPPKCMVCGAPYSAFCYNCLNNCAFNNISTCLMCDKPAVKGFTHAHCQTTVSPDHFFAPLKYEKDVRKCIRLSKYPPKEFSTLKDLTKFAVKLSQKTGHRELYKNAVVVPIPLNKNKSKDRGFNQSDIIAGIVANAYNLRTNKALLIRTKNTKTQAGLGRADRIKNVNLAFSINSRIARNELKSKNTKKILLVDDISTTGATFLAASKVLKQAGFETVCCFALSKKI